MSRRMEGTETVIEKEIKQWEMERERGEEKVQEGRGERRMGGKPPFPNFGKSSMSYVSPFLRTPMRCSLSFLWLPGSLC